MSEISLRIATPDDSASLAALVRAAQDEAGIEAPHGVGDSTSALNGALSGETPLLEGVVAEEPGAGLIGFAIAYRGFSTVTLRPGFHLLDIFVSKSHRRKGVARLIMQSVARLAVTRGYAHVLWSVQANNSDAISFYKKLGAIGLVDTRLFAVAGDPLVALAQGEMSGK